MNDWLEGRELLALNWLVANSDDCTTETTKGWNEVQQGLAENAGIIDEGGCRKVLETLTVMNFIEGSHGSTLKSYGRDYTTLEVPTYIWKPTKRGMEQVRRERPRLIVLMTRLLTGNGAMEKSIEQETVLERLGIEETIGNSIVEQLHEDGELAVQFGGTMLTTAKGASKALVPPPPTVIDEGSRSIVVSGDGNMVMTDSPGASQKMIEQGISSDQLMSLIEHLSGSAGRLQLIEEKQKELENAISDLREESAKETPSQGRIKGILKKISAIVKTGGDAMVVANVLKILLPLIVM
jgi:hypothetical protein